MKGESKRNHARRILFCENETDVHIEVLANWSSDAPKGSPEGGHVVYLNITAVLINETTGSSDTHKLTPHVNMSTICTMLKHQVAWKNR